MRVALYQPDIAGNVGAVMRTCACLGTPLDLIEPLGFQWDDRRVARVAMDYIDHVALTRHAGWDAFQAQATGRLVLLTTRGATPLHAFAFRPDDVLLFGRESAGVPDAVHARADARVVIPMAPPLRSLNLSVSAAIVLAEACGRRADGRTAAPRHRLRTPGPAKRAAMPPLDPQQTAARTWFETLRDRICAEFEAIEREAGSNARFDYIAWDRPDPSGEPGGGGVRGVMKGRVFEKVGVNISTVGGTFEGDFAKSIHGAGEDPRFFATGISLVAHMANPHVPAVHMNCRFLRTTRQWFGGGADLNPPLPIPEDTADFHAELRAACDAHGADYYDRFSRWAEEYFRIPHRGVDRGVGGIFFDHLEADFDRDFAFVQDVGRAFLAAYPRIVRRRLATPFTPVDEAAMLEWRGRYAEFNLVYDRGTLFGLKTGGNIDAILMSLPPRAAWS